MDPVTLKARLSLTAAEEVMSGSLDAIASRTAARAGNAIAARSRLGYGGARSRRGHGAVAAPRRAGCGPSGRAAAASRLRETLPYQLFLRPFAGVATSDHAQSLLMGCQASARGLRTLRAVCRVCTVADCALWDSSRFFSSSAYDVSSATSGLGFQYFDRLHKQKTFQAASRSPQPATSALSKPSQQHDATVPHRFSCKRAPAHVCAR